MTRLYTASLALICGLALVRSSASAQTPSFKVIHALKGGADGAEPYGRLTRLGNRLYGTTLYGGGSTKCSSDYSCGTLYSVNPATHAAHVLHAFGIDAGDGLSPAAGVTRVGYTLYGVTSGTDSPSTSSCNAGCGDIFSFKPATGAYQIVYAFQGGTDGAQPAAELTDVGDVLYGTTQHGGGASFCAAAGCGTIFSFDPKTGTEKTLYAFPGSVGGFNPTGQMIDIDGTLFGMTYAGGKANAGTLFSFDPATGTFSILYNFKGGKDGALPGINARLYHIGNTLYGTTQKGGVSSDDIAACSKGGKGCGTIFAFDLKTGTETILHSFTGQEDGTYPVTGLVDLSGKLYGTSSPATCGDLACGIIYALDPKTGVFNVVFTATKNNEGRGFYTTLRNIDGTLYGTGEIGGKAGCNLITGGECGTVFAFTP